jgi:amino acid adenylation domain-containing protein
MLGDAGPGAVLVGEPVAGFGGARIEAERLADPEAPAAAPVRTGPAPSDESIAYALFTSGSTGKPRMVPVPRRPYARQAAEATRRYGVVATDRVLQVAALTFDISLEEVALWLSAGATLVLRDDEAAASPGAMLAFCAARRVTVLDLPTVYWHGVVDFLDRRRLPPPPAVRRVILGGEAVLPERAADWRRLAGPEARLLNTYGPTEATIAVTAADLSAPELSSRSGPAGSNGAGARAVAIGRPLDHARLYLVDARGRPVATEAVGELWIGGDTLARGYPGRSGATASSWIPDAFGADHGGRLYRTGDLARRRADGTYEFAGRLDDQLKVRGFRVEPGEVAAALAAHPGVGEAFVLARKGAGGEARLCAWVAVGEDPTVTLADVRTHARSRLPAFMVPHDLVLLPELPITAHGKVDRRALPEPEDGAGGDDGWLPPDGPTEEALAALWGELLGRDRVGARDDFFDLGGHSLLAPRLMARIEETFDLELPLPLLFEAPTLRELALEIERELLAEIEALSEEEAERLLGDETEELWM